MAISTRMTPSRHRNSPHSPADWVLLSSLYPSHRRRQPTADIDVLRQIRAVRLLLRLHDDDLRAGFELVLVAGGDRLDHGRSEERRVGKDCRSRGSWLP